MLLRAEPGGFEIKDCKASLVVSPAINFQGILTYGPQTGPCFLSLVEHGGIAALAIERLLE